MNSTVDEVNILAEKITGTNPKMRTIKSSLDYISSYLAENDVNSKTIKEAVKNFTDNYSGGGSGEQNFYTPFTFPDLSADFVYKWIEELQGYMYSQYNYDANLDLVTQLLFSPHFIAPFRMIVKQGYQGEEIDMIAEQSPDGETGNYKISAHSQDNVYAFDISYAEPPETGDYIMLLSNVTGFITPNN